LKTKKQPESLAVHWSNHIKSWEQSDQSQAAYCRSQDLNYHRFTYWRRKCSTADAGPGTEQSIQRSGFVPVQSQSTALTQELTATLPNGVLLQGINTDNLAIVKQLLGLRA